MVSTTYTDNIYHRSRQRSTASLVLSQERLSKTAVEKYFFFRDEMSLWVREQFSLPRFSLLAPPTSPHLSRAILFVPDC